MKIWKTLFAALVALALTLSLGGLMSSATAKDRGPKDGSSQVKEPKVRLKHLESEDSEASRLRVQAVRLLPTDVVEVQKADGETWVTVTGVELRCPKAKSKGKSESAPRGKCVAKGSVEALPGMYRAIVTRGDVVTESETVVVDEPVLDDDSDDEVEGDEPGDDSTTDPGTDEPVEPQEPTVP